MMWPWQRRALEEARDREFRLLQTDPEPFPGIVWGCARWWRCRDRIVETPPYGGRQDPERCMAATSAPVNQTDQRENRDMALRQRGQAPADGWTITGVHDPVMG